MKRYMGYIRISVIGLISLHLYSPHALGGTQCTSNELNAIGASPTAFKGKVKRIVAVVKKGDSKTVMGHVIVSGAECEAQYLHKADGTYFDYRAERSDDSGSPCSEHSVNLKVLGLIASANKNFEGWEPKGSPLVNFPHYKNQWVPRTGSMVCDSLVDLETSSCTKACRVLYDKNPESYCENTLPILLKVSPNSPCKACCDSTKTSNTKPIAGEKSLQKRKLKFKDLFSKSNSLGPLKDDSTEVPRATASGSPSTLKEKIDDTPLSLRPMRKLKASLKKYEKFIEKLDFEAASKWVPEALLKKWGGVSGYKKMMTDLFQQAESSQGVKLASLKTYHPSAIEEGDKLWVSVIPTEFVIKREGTSGYLFASMIAVSENKGADWTFIEVGKDSKVFLTEKDLKVLKKIKVAKRKMLTEKDKVKTFQVQNDGKWQVISEKEFYRDLPQRKGILHELGNWFKKQKAQKVDGATE